MVIIDKFPELVWVVFMLEYCFKSYLAFTINNRIYIIADSLPNLSEKP